MALSPLANLRSRTLGKSKKFRTRLVTLRDASKPRVREPVLDAAGAPVLEPVLLADGSPKLDESGAAVTEPKTTLRHPPEVDEEGKPVQVEVREPNLKVRSLILRNSKAQVGEAEKVDLAALQVEAVLQCTYVPGTETKVFTEVDREELLGQPVGGFVDDIAEVVLPLLNVDTEEVAKNSTATGSA